jgi:YVTN family beta-propeller protein
VIDPENPQPVATQLDVTLSPITAAAQDVQKPQKSVLNPCTRKLYVPNAGDNSLTVIDTNNFAVLATVHLGCSPVGAAVNTINNQIYTVSRDGVVTAVSGSTHRVVAQIPVEGIPTGISVDILHNLIYVSNEDTSATVIDGRTNRVAYTLPIGYVGLNVEVFNPSNLLCYCNGHTAPTGPANAACGCSLSAFTYVSDGNRVHVIDPLSHAMLVTVPMGFAVAAMGSDPALRKVYLVSASGQFAVFDAVTNTIATTLDLPEGDYTQSTISVNENNHQVYIAAAGNEFIAVVNGFTDELRTVIALESTGSIAVNTNTNLIYASTAQGLDIINSNTNP